MDFLKSYAVEVVALGKDTSQPEAELAWLVDCVEIVKHNDEFFAIDSWEIFGFIDTDTYFSFFVEQLLEFLTSHLLR